MEGSGRLRRSFCFEFWRDARIVAVGCCFGAPDLPNLNRHGRVASRAGEDGKGCGPCQTMRVPRSLYSEERLKGVKEGLSKKKLLGCGVLYNGCAKYRTELV